MTSLLYIPRSAITRAEIESLIQVFRSNDVHRVDDHGGRRAVLKYLLAMKHLNIDLSPYIHEEEFQQLQKRVDQYRHIDPYRSLFDETRSNAFEEYWELNLESSRIHSVANKARNLIKQSEKFSLQQLKVYFNKTQVENIPYSNATFEQSGFPDDDARNCTRTCRIADRHNKGEINTVVGRIEDAVFRVPHGSQVIVLDFADERMPGGLFLYGARTQEETICYNSNTYQALLDFKYKLFDGGFMIPEFGCLYIKRALFYKPDHPSTHRHADVVAGACYDLTREHGLYTAPPSNDEIEANTRKKLETIVAAAQANSDGKGEHTYLIIGPIGCGAFQNNLQTIAKLWAEILATPLNANGNTQQRHAFAHVWFLSGKADKLDIFEQACATAFNNQHIVHRI